jgi:acyl-CoA thioesterase-2
MTEPFDIPPTIPIDQLLAMLRAEPVAGGLDRYVAHSETWHGDRLFGGVVVAQALDAACRTIDGDWMPHSLHAAFLGPVRSGGVDLAVERVRDGRTFSTRSVTTSQGGRETTRTVVSFHRDEPGPEYQLGMPTVPPPEACELDGPMSLPIEIRMIGPTEPRSDGTFRSTRRTWMRLNEQALGAPVDHRVLAALVSDMTGTSFRPHNLDEWGTHTDASIDHAVWFHRPCRLDEWLYADFHTVISTSARSTVRGEWFQDGRLVMSMAQELLVRELSGPPSG